MGFRISLQSSNAGEIALLAWPLHALGGGGGGGERVIPTSSTL
jgi:hypothetical protein